MNALTTATLVEPDVLDAETRIDTTIDRAELEALRSSETPQLWFEILSEGSEEPQRVTLDLTQGDLHGLLEGADGEELTLALDALALADVLQEPDVEAHGLRTGTAIAIAVVTGAVAAPSALGATQQVSPATKLQVASQQVVSQQAVGTAATRQVTRQVVRSQLHTGRISPLKLGLTVLRAGAVR